MFEMFNRVTTGTGQVHVSLRLLTLDRAEKCIRNKFFRVRARPKAFVF